MEPCESISFERVMYKFKRLEMVIRGWNKSMFGNLNKNIAEAMVALDSI